MDLIRLGVGGTETACSSFSGLLVLFVVMRIFVVKVILLFFVKVIGLVK